jgi:hypothetical protein
LAARRNRPPTSSASCAAGNDTFACLDQPGRAAYGQDLYDRLTRIKEGFDPNLFRSNPNIMPATG